jgi:hypothetical protein
MAALMYAGDNQGYLPDDLSPNSPRLLVVRNLSPVTLRRGEPQDSVPPTVWNPALEGAQLENIAHPERTVLYFEGLEDKNGNRFVTFVQGKLRAVSGPVVIDAVLNQGGVVSESFAREVPSSASARPRITSE